MPSTALSQLDRATAADSCACEHLQAGHYRGRVVCRKLSCSCSAFRGHALAGDGLGGAVPTSPRAAGLT